MLGDITIYDEDSFGYSGDNVFVVSSGAVASINAGEPVSKPLGVPGTVSALATSKPVVGTDFLAGVSATTSTDTTTANGSIRVTKPNELISYLIAPKTASTWNTQAKYDALVGARVTFDLTTGVYTINASDGSTNGLVVEPLDIVKFPGKVRFTIRQGAFYNT